MLPSKYLENAQFIILFFFFFLSFAGAGDCKDQNGPMCIHVKSEECDKNTIAQQKCAKTCGKCKRYLEIARAIRDL